MANWVGLHGYGCPGAPPPAQELIPHLHQLLRTLQESAHLIHEASTPGTAQEADADGNLDIELGQHVHAIVQHKQQATTKRTQNGPTNQGSRRRTTQTTTSRRSCQTRGEDVGAPGSQNSSIHQCSLSDQHSHSYSTAWTPTTTLTVLPRQLKHVSRHQDSTKFTQEKDFEHCGLPPESPPACQAVGESHPSSFSTDPQPAPPPSAGFPSTSTHLVCAARRAVFLFHLNAHIWIFLNNLLTVCCRCCSVCAFSQSGMWLQQ